jgi:hypothetical protein
MIYSDIERDSATQTNLKRGQTSSNPYIAVYFSSRVRVLAEILEFDSKPEPEYVCELPTA